MKNLPLTLLLGIILTSCGPTQKPNTWQTQPLQLASPSSEGFTKEKIMEIDKLFQSNIETGNIAGATALIARRGKIVYYQSTGYNDLNSNSLLEKDAIFRIASQTKGITSVAIMRLYEEGKLDLQDPVSKHLEAFKYPKIIDQFNEKDSSYIPRPAKREVTILDLLTHTSGYAYPGNGGEAGNAIYAKAEIMNGVPSKSAELKDEMQKISQLPLIHQPGERFTYGLSTDILGYVVEVLSGKNLEEYFRTEIFDPLGMEDTYFHLPEHKHDRLMNLYLGRPGKKELIIVPEAKAGYPKNANMYYSGGGGLSSTTMDYAIFLQMLLNEGEYNGTRILKPETVHLMRKNHIGKLDAGSLFLPESRDKFGLGFEVISPSKADSMLISPGSFGWGGAFGSLYWIDPEKELIAHLVIQKAGEYAQLRYDFINAVYGALNDESNKDPKNDPSGQNTDISYRDIYPDTWVATDALGRTMPAFEEVGTVKEDKRRVTGIFYITWHTQDKHKEGEDYQADVSKILKKDPGARLDANHELWYTKSYHWGEPEMGYFLSQDEYVIRKDMSMLADAGIDVLIMDVTNAVRYWDEWDVTFKVLQQMKEEGNKVPKFCFWAFNGPVITVVQDLFEKIYKEEKYKDLWFYWDEKPLLLYNGRPDFDANRGGIKHPNPNYDPAAKTDPSNAHFDDPDYTEEFYLDYTREVKDFFTLRTMWWGYYEWGGERFVGTEDNWSFGYSLADEKVKALKPEELLSTHKGIREEAAVTAAQHPVTMSDLNMGVGKSWSRENGQPALNEYDLPVPSYVPWLGDTVENPTGYGIYFQERWDEAIKADPEFLYINDWNEWTAGKYQPTAGGTLPWFSEDKTTPWLGRNNPFFFVDQYNSEFNRCIHPMKGGYTDNYYMQMAQNIRRYKGVRPIPENHGFDKVKVDGWFADWDKVVVEYRDTRGDVYHRDHPGYGGLHYTDKSGRNDIITSKIAVNKKSISFYVETDQPLTPHQDQNWMLLFLDTDQDASTGWYGYDFMVNGQVKNDNQTSLQEYDVEKAEWVHASSISYSYNENKLELLIPRARLGLHGEQFTLDFKWSDNPKGLNDPISFCTGGDTAPNRKFNYRIIWKKQ